MKSRLLIGLFSLTLSTGALANDNPQWLSLLFAAIDTSHLENDRDYRATKVRHDRDVSHRNRYGRDRYDDYPHALRLYTKVKVNGDYRIPLRRMIREQHGIDTKDYRIRAVTVHNKARYPACADLQIGGRSSGVVDLNRGSTRIFAPRGRADGRWVLEVGAARVRGVTVELEPRRHLARHDNRGYKSFDHRDDQRYRRWNR